MSISGGHFHGQYVAQAMDLLAIAVADLGSISERRLARLIDPTMSYGLPRNLLAGKKGLNTGFATVQCSMSALVMENRTLCMPGSVDSIPGKSNAEDHVSNSTWCARKARTVVENVEQIVAGELLMAAQALSLVEPIARDHPLGRGSRAALEAIRAVIPRPSMATAGMRPRCGRRWNSSAPARSWLPWKRRLAHSNDRAPIFRPSCIRQALRRVTPLQRDDRLTQSTLVTPS